MALRSVNLFSNSQRLFGSPTSTGANLYGGWSATASASTATATLTLASANNGTYSSTADKTFVVTVDGVSYSFIANASFTVSGGSATVAVTASANGYKYNDVANGGVIPNSSAAFTNSTVLGSGTATAGTISGGQGDPTTRLLYNNASYFTYIPEDYTNSVGNILGFRAEGTNDVTILSPVVALGDAINLFSGIAVVAGDDELEFTTSIEFLETELGSALTTTNTEVVTSVDAKSRKRCYNIAVAPSNAEYVRFKLVVSRSGAALPYQTVFFLFDPVIADFTYANNGNITTVAYNDLPNFMLLDDAQISNLTDEELGSKTTGTLTLTSCTNGTYDPDTEFTVTVNNSTYTYTNTS